jgi:ferric-dicitrate binding protein FerR (iron transport regulator)
VVPPGKVSTPQPVALTAVPFRLIPQRRARALGSAVAVIGSVTAGWIAGGLARRASVRTGVGDEEAFESR